MTVLVCIYTAMYVGSVTVCLPYMSLCCVVLIVTDRRVTLMLLQSATRWCCHLFLYIVLAPPSIELFVCAMKTVLSMG